MCHWAVLGGCLSLGTIQHTPFSCPLRWRLSTMSSPPCRAESSETRNRKGSFFLFLQVSLFLVHFGHMIQKYQTQDWSRCSAVKRLSNLQRTEPEPNPSVQVGLLMTPAPGTLTAPSNLCQPWHTHGEHKHTMNLL